MRPTTIQDRRQFLRTASAGALAWSLLPSFSSGQERASDYQAPQDERVRVLMPRDRVPLSFIIDDSTCLVNMGHYCMPQFAAAWPDRDNYHKPWKSWPREIPDAFVREFGEWCGEQGVKGKYSVVPYPACVGWLDRELPGWSRKELLDSLKLVRELMVPNWDIHPEMITHTRVIDLASGRPLEEISSATMENSYPREPKSVDYLASYLAYSLQILKNCDLPCEGITTPGGFGNMVKSELSLAVHEAVRDVYAVEIPHYFKYVVGGDGSTEPQLEHVREPESDAPRITVNVPAGTGDWFGGWDGDLQPEANRYSDREARQGRMVELIEQRRPAVMLCHWPGMYTQGTKVGFQAFQQVVLALQQRFGDTTIWMKLSEMARYWAVRRLARIEGTTAGLQIRSPFACPQFTLRLQATVTAEPRLIAGNQTRPLKKTSDRRGLVAGSWLSENDATIVCVDLPKGTCSLIL